MLAGMLVSGLAGFVIDLPTTNNFSPAEGHNDPNFHAKLLNIWAKLGGSDC